MAAAFEALAGTRPRIRRDVLFTETPGGVLFHNADGGFHLTGRTAYRFASLLVPHLNGRHSLADICQGFPDAQRAMAAGLVDRLYDRGFARSVPEEDDDVAAHVPDPAAAERFAPQIAYIDHYTGGAPARFRRFRDARVAVLGRGPVARWCAVSLLRNGCAHIAVQEASAEVGAEERELAEGGCPARVDRLETEPRGWAALEGYDVVVVTGDGAAPLAHRLLAEGVPDGRTLLPSWTFGDRAVTGPVSRPGGTGCLGCALLRLGAATDADAAAETWSVIAGVVAPREPVAGGGLHGPVAAMTGNLLGYEVFRLTTGALRAETDGQILLQELESLDVVAEPLRPHPRCRLCTPEAEPPDAAEETGAARVLAEGLALPRTATVATARDAEQTVEDLNALGTALVRPHAGVFTRFDDEDLTQTPLKLSRVELPLGAGGKRRIAAFDVHHLAGARTRALYAAAAVYVEHVVPPALDGGGEVAASSLLTKEPVRVPAAAVRPFGPHNRARVHPATRAGSGAGATPQEAAGTGLLSALAHDALLRALRGAARPTLLAVESGTTASAGEADGDAAAQADPELVFLRKTAATIGVDAELLDLGESAHSSAHVVLAREADGARWAVGCDLNREAAACAALRDLLGQAQLVGDDAAGERGDVDLGDPLVPDLAPSTLVVEGDPELPADAPDTDWNSVLDRLRAAGRDVLHVPTTPADLRTAGVHTARVLLTGGPEDGACAQR
ncbi:TOMM precursor leader peptide-binding protein [Streptomyces sp. RKND-216]|uniref:TOMM precursor leader peptide-binding protein n=1 Tax=Streptomyces sp. RKND-216 TaxID=2562581 RepID=UPI00109DFF60|nr:TOMM precursor leader peptide-binding protein [Streptomyces sp. RKND-216]THA25565.1 TOMM precursor leader peptide-binding protein [Streptomyces sp. RKND-216]